MKEEFDGEYLHKFLATALERHAIYLKKEAGDERPYTNDVIFEHYRFCNVFRQYDRCSKWMIEHVVPLERLELIVLYRYLSSYDMYVDIEGMGIIADVPAVMEYLAETSTPFITCFSRTGDDSHDADYPKLAETLEDARRLDDTQFLLNDTLEGMTEMLKLELRHTDGFLAYEYACDLEYGSYWRPTDRFRWANKGPGSEKGLSLVKNRHWQERYSEAEYERGLTLLYVSLFDAFQRVYPDQEVTMRDVEHWLCEFYKYCKFTLHYRTNADVSFKYYKAYGGETSNV